MPTKRSSAAKKTSQRRNLRAAGKKSAKTGKRKVAARKAVATQKLKATTVETLPTTEQVEEIENKLRAGVIAEMEPADWPKTKKEIQESLKDYKQKVKWARKRGAADTTGPEDSLHIIRKLEEVLKHNK